MAKTSRYRAFINKARREAQNSIRILRSYTEEASCISATGALSLDAADRMVENLIGVMEVPMGVAVNFLINGRDYLIPMAIEEPSVIAAASNSAKMAREGGGFTTSSTGPVMMGQIQAVGIKDPNGARLNILRKR